MIMSMFDERVATVFSRSVETLDAPQDS